MNMDEKTRMQIEKERISKDRNALVVKSNVLLKDARYKLSASDQKVIIFLISKIIADDKDFKHMSMSVQEYCNLTNITRGGNGDKKIKESIKTLSDKSWWFKENGDETLFRWIDTAKITKDGYIDIVLSDSLKPYLLELEKNFTKYELINVLTLKSKHSIRLYELFKSNLWLHKWKVSIADIKEILNIQDKYREYKDLNKRVIAPAVKEISKYTDIKVEYEPIRTGRYNTDFIFYIEEKRGYQMTWETILNQEERLG